MIIRKDNRMSFRQWWNDPKVPTNWDMGDEKAAAKAAWEAATKVEREACADAIRALLAEVEHNASASS